MQNILLHMPLNRMPKRTKRKFGRYVLKGAAKRWSAPAALRTSHTAKVRKAIRSSIHRGDVIPHRNPEYAQGIHLLRSMVDNCLNPNNAIQVLRLFATYVNTPDEAIENRLANGEDREIKFYDHTTNAFKALTAFDLRYIISRWNLVEMRNSAPRYEEVAELIEDFKSVESRDPTEATIVDYQRLYNRVRDKLYEIYGENILWYQDYYEPRRMTIKSPDPVSLPVLNEIIRDSPKIVAEVLKTSVPRNHEVVDILDTVIGGNLSTSAFEGFKKAAIKILPQTGVLSPLPLKDLNIIQSVALSPDDPTDGLGVISPSGFDNFGPSTPTPENVPVVKATSPVSDWDSALALALGLPPPEKPATPVQPRKPIGKVAVMKPPVYQPTNTILKGPSKPVLSRSKAQEPVIEEPRTYEDYIIAPWDKKVMNQMELHRRRMIGIYQERIRFQWLKKEKPVPPTWWLKKNGYVWNIPEDHVLMWYMNRKAVPFSRHGKHFNYDSRITPYKHTKKFLYNERPLDNYYPKTFQGNRPLTKQRWITDPDTGKIGTENVTEHYVPRPIKVYDNPILKAVERSRVTPSPEITIDYGDMETVSPEYKVSRNTYKRSAPKKQSNGITLPSNIGKRKLDADFITREEDVIMPNPLAKAGGKRKERIYDLGHYLPEDLEDIAEVMPQSKRQALDEGYSPQTDEDGIYDDVGLPFERYSPLGAEKIHLRNIGLLRDEPYYKHNPKVKRPDRIPTPPWTMLNRWKRAHPGEPVPEDLLPVYVDEYIVEEPDDEI